MNILPRKPEVNPKENVNAITLRSGKELKSKDLNEDILDPSRGEAINADENNKGNEEKTEKITKDTVDTELPTEPTTKIPFIPPSYEPKFPFPERFKKQLRDKYKALFDEQLSKVALTIPLLEAFSMVPKWTKYLKDAVEEKSKELEGTVMLIQECSAIIQKKIIKEKVEDPGSFTLPCALESLTFSRCLCNLGDSVNHMPLSVAKIWVSKDLRSAASP